MGPHMKISINNYLRRHNSSSDSSSDDEDTKREKKNKRIHKQNSKINAGERKEEIYPKKNSKDKLPKDFDRARRVEWFLALDSATLDRINETYGLPTTGFADSHNSTKVKRFREKWQGKWGDSYYSDAQREHRVLNLFEFLGVDCTGKGSSDDEEEDCPKRSGGRGNRGLGWA